MTDYYMGVGGSDAADGTTWANRRLTFANSENLLGAGDRLIVGPGSYTGTNNTNWTLGSKSGTSGNPIIYEGDPTGRRTDGVGGEVRLYDTAGGDYFFDNNQATSWRTYRNITFNIAEFMNILTAGSDTITSYVFENCIFYRTPLTGIVSNVFTTTWRRCQWFGSWNADPHLTIGSGGGNTNTNSVIENCIFWGSGTQGPSCVNLLRADNLTIRNNLFIGQMEDQNDAHLNISLANGQDVFIYNNLFVNLDRSSMPGTMDLNTSYGTTFNVVANNNYYYPDRVIDGAASGRYQGGSQEKVGAPPHMVMPMLYNGYQFPWQPFVWSARFQGAFQGVASGTSGPTGGFFEEDVQTDDKRAIGPFNYRHSNRNTDEFPTGGSASSVELPDNMLDMIILPVDGGVSWTVSCQVKRRTGYNGTLPQLAVHTPGVTSVIDTDVGAANTWNSLSAAITPIEDYIAIEIRNNNTKKKSRAVYFSDFDVSLT